MLELLPVLFVMLEPVVVVAVFVATPFVVELFVPFVAVFCSAVDPVVPLVEPLVALAVPVVPAWFWLRRFVPVPCELP